MKGLGHLKICNHNFFFPCKVSFVRKKFSNYIWLLGQPSFPIEEFCGVIKFCCIYMKSHLQQSDHCSCHGSVLVVGFLRSLGSCRLPSSRCCCSPAISAMRIGLGENATLALPAWKEVMTELRTGSLCGP